MISLKPNAALILGATAALFASSVAVGGAFPVRSSSQASPRAALGAGSGHVVWNKGRRIVVGSAAAKARAMQRMLPDDFVLPTNPMYVADPSLNAVVIYDMVPIGNQYPVAILSGPNTQLNGPSSAAEGYDQPCSGGYDAVHCTNYLYVSNAGNGTVTVYHQAIGQPPLGIGNQAPSSVFWNGSCSPSFGFGGGIFHLKPTVGDANNGGNGYVAIPDSSTIQLYAQQSVNSVCWYAYATNPAYTSATGISAQGALPKVNLFNANSDTVTRTSFIDATTFAFLGPVWTVGTGAATQGTAFDGGEPAGGYLWVSTVHNGNFPSDGLWMCKYNAFNAAGCNAGTPTIYGSATLLNYPAYIKASSAYHRLYVPNINSGIVTSYREAWTGNHAPLTVYHNLVTPFGVALTGE
jgi:hypothetical protein